MQKKIEFSVGKQKVAGDLHLPEGGKPPFPCLVLSHGFMSNRGGEKQLQIGLRFPQEGIAVLRFDHRGARGGESEGEFEDTTLTARVEDLAAALDFLKSVPQVDSKRLGLFGSSLGGMTILALPPDERVKAIVLLSTPHSLPPPVLAVREAFVRNGVYEYPDGTRLKQGFYDDLPQYNLLEAVKKITCPKLIIHGDLDELVPRHQAFTLYRNADQPRELQMVEGADHSFSSLDKMNRALALTLDWCKKYLF